MAVLEMVMELEAETAVDGWEAFAVRQGAVVVAAEAIALVAAVVGGTIRCTDAFLCGSLTTVMDKLFLPGSMYVSLTHTIPSRRLALTLDEVFDEEDDMGAKVEKKNTDSA